MRAAAPLVLLALLPTAAALALPDAVTVAIVDVTAERAGSDVFVHVLLTGSSSGLAGTGVGPVTGEVSITTRTPCWGDQLPCVDEVTTKTLTFSAVSTGPAWSARVGAYRYPVGPAPDCEGLDVDAVARSGIATANDSGAFLRCA